MKFLKSILPVITAGLFAAGISIMFNSDVVRATLYHWSSTAASNSNADGTINWAEGQSPSSVNDSARAMMAATAKFRDDTSGKLVTTGTSTAYVITSNQVFDTLANLDGARLTFQVNVTSGASPTLNVDGLGAKPINSVSGTAIPSGSLIIGGVYSATYVNASNQWIIHNGLGSTVSAASGTVMLSTATSCPGGWTKSVANNDKALRLVSGTPGTGGTVAFSTAFARTATDTLALTQANLPSYTLPNTLSLVDPGHSHNISPQAAQVSGTYTAGGVNFGATAGPGATQSSTTGMSIAGSVTSGGSGTAHAHNIDLRVQYVDVIACSKD